MNLGPFTWLFIVAPAAVLAAVIFLYIYEEHRDETGIQQAKFELEKAKFDRDFAAAWNGGNVTGPEESEIVKIKARIEAKERQAKEERQKQCEKLAAIEAELQKTLGADAIAENVNKNCKEIN